MKPHHERNIHGEFSFHVAGFTNPIRNDKHYDAESKDSNHYPVRFTPFHVAMSLPGDGCCKNRRLSTS